MYKSICCCLILGFSIGSAHADTQRADYNPPASRAETTGFFSGALLGGLAGGPPGVIVGGALGALLGDGLHAKHEVGDLRADLYAMQLEVAMVRERNAILQQEYQLARQQLDNTAAGSPRYQDVGLTQPALDNCCNNTSLSLHFRSGSAVIESHYEDQLMGLARLAQILPTTAVEITGYADRNGDADKNLALSRLRSENVKHFLNMHGIGDASITTVAYGESRPLQAQQDMQTDFFDRRVIVRLRNTTQQMLTHNPDGK